MYSLFSALTEKWKQHQTWNNITLKVLNRSVRNKIIHNPQVNALYTRKRKVGVKWTLLALHTLLLGYETED